MDETIDDEQARGIGSTDHRRSDVITSDAIDVIGRTKTA